ncbi:alpha-2-macroglobulin family protein [Defluviimonas salinarum]|uniref:Alpha-2-macroglobulin family protein n=1 Tax=Defluviimonas salinarum TaxID=2992147 RepID=A0ABT3J312_9RHOB|nr:alpha-2-macroglobulin family protein [Defluviimonas salinarum]MCW3782067.1 alpha-2-macroglobulin family protein [Defluviimonas salinarum]
MLRVLPAALVALLAVSAVTAQDRDYIPDRRAALVEGIDFPGADLRALFDVEYNACASACLTDGACRAFTFNRRAGSCFLKTEAGTAEPYSGAVSGRIIAAAEGATEQARNLATDLSFLREEDFDAALEQANGLSVAHPTGIATETELIAAERAARDAEDWPGVAEATGAALNISDSAGLWADYAAALLEIPANRSKRRDNADRAAAAAINAYLRADAPALRATALATLARAFETVERGPDMIPALRLAQRLQPRDETAAALEDAIGKYGFRIAETQVDSDAAMPRICATFTADLIRAGTDYAPFVKLDAAGLAVDASGRQICVSGVEHGRRYAVTFREGLPAADGEELAKDVTLNLYVRDRAPAVRFPGRAYVLPRTDRAGIPVETVNTDRLDLTLLRISDRNLIRAIQSDYFGRPLDYWSSENLKGQVAEEVWAGTGEVGMEVNRDVTTRLPLDAVMEDLGPGIYSLQAGVPGLDPYDHPPATQWFVISDLGLTTFEGTDGLHVVVRALSGATAAEGATATLLSRANAVIATARTDAEGLARFAAGLTAGTGGAVPALVTVEKDGDFAFLPLTEPEFDLSDRGVAGREAAPPIDVFLATDRGAYRAGETVHTTILARDSRMEALDGLPMTVRLLRPDGVEYSRILAAAVGAGGHVATLPLAASAPRGTWRIESFVEDGKVLAADSLLVEDFLPERIDFDLTLPEGALRLADTPALGIAARYLFGAPGAGLAVEGDLRIAALDRLDAFPGYGFGRHDEPFSPYRDALPEVGPTDAEGRATLAAALPDLGEAGNRPLEARFAVRLKEGSGRPVEREVARRILPDAPVIGIKPLFEGGTVAQGDEARFELIAVGPDEAPAARSAHWTLNRIETDYQWYSLYGQWNWEVTTTRHRVAEGDVALTATGAEAIAAPVDWGNYELVVEAADGTYSAASVEFHAGWYAPADATETPDTVPVTLDKPAYRPGDTAVVRLEPRADGVALVTVMSNRLIDMKAVPVTAGETLVELPVTDDWGAGAYVAASVIRPLDADAGRAPARALGLSYAAVDPGPRRLAAAFEVAPEAAPRGPLPVALKVEGATAGEPVLATIAAVDVGILNLTGFSSPDPEGHYFGQRKLGVGIRDLYGRLIDGQAGVKGAVRSGGDGASGLKMQAPPPTEELVAYFSGPLTVGADGYARTEFALPSFNGTVRLMAVAWSKSAIGQAEAEVLVRDPVVVTASLPRFLAPGDESRLLLEIVHATGPAGRIGLDVNGEGLTLGAAPSGLDLTEGGKAVVSVPVTAGDTEDTGTIRVALTTPDGRQLVKDLDLPVQSNEPEVARQSRFDLAAGDAFTLDANVFAGLVPGSGRATLAVGPIARFDAPGLLAALDAYPYGCTEQLTSKALPLLYFEEVARAMGTGQSGDIRTRVEESIAEILLNQSSNGAFGLWHADTGDLWLDAYVTDFLSRAKAQGYPVPDTAFRSALDNLRNQINYAPDFDAGGGAYAYALMVLAREGAAAVGDLRYYADVKTDAFDTPIAAAQLGAALASYGDQRRADAMFTAAARLIDTRTGTEEAPLWRADYGTDLRDATALLALAAEAGSAAVSPETLGNDVARALTGKRLSTQEATWALLATHALIDRPGADGFTVNGAAVEGPLVRVLEAAAAMPQVIANGSGRDATVTLSTFGVPAEPEPAGGKGYAIERSYYTLEGEPADIATVRQGARLVAMIEVTPHGRGEARLMVDDPLPAGFEIDNPSLIRAGDIATLGWLDSVAETRTTEFRQDRFLAAVDWTTGEPFRLAYLVRAISPGSFHHPAASVEDMYRPDYRARTATGRVVVSE